MATVTIHQREFDIDGIVFDKDDTLIEFNALWGPRTQRWVEAIVGLAGLSNISTRGLYAMLGYSPEQTSVRPESPLAIASIATLSTLVAGVLCQQGIPWHEACHYARSTAQDTILSDVDPREIQPKGNVRNIMRKLRQADIQIAVVTSDDRRFTEATLSHLGVLDIVSVIVCGDDPIPNKPAPDAFYLVAEQWGVAPNRMMMVGDSANDMQFAINAGAGFRIGVVSASGDASALAAQADEFLASIDELNT